MELTAVISVLRHGEKDVDGSLTHTGARQAKSAAVATTHLEGDVILMHSGVGRVEDTIKSVARHLHLVEDDPEEFLEEEAALQSYVSPYLHYLYDANNKGELFSKWDAPDMDDDAKTKRMQQFLNLADTSPEPSIFPSPLKMAQRVAKVITTQIEFALLTESRYRTNFVNGTHEPVLMSFIAYLLNDFEHPGENYVSEIGGSVRYAEGIDILVYQDSDSYEVSASFRGLVCPLSLSLLKQHAEKS